MTPNTHGANVSKFRADGVILFPRFVSRDAGESEMKVWIDTSRKSSIPARDIESLQKQFDGRLEVINGRSGIIIRCPYLKDAAPFTPNSLQAYLRNFRICVTLQPSDEAQMARIN